MFALVWMLSLLLGANVWAASGRLLNVSYDPTRELYEAINPVFRQEWKAKTGQEIRILQSHGGSGKQARAVMDGLGADVVTLALAYDVDILALQGNLLPTNWQSRLPHNSAPFSSSIVFLVRKGNPKGVRDWDDLVKPGVAVMTPNPKSSGGARWNYLAAYGYQLKRPGGSDAKAREFVTKLYKNVAVLDTGARASTMNFTRRQIGDVLITWEDEALLAVSEWGKGQFELVVPSMTIKAEPPVALVDKNVDKHKTREVAQAYLEFLYSEKAQEIAAQHFFRPTSQTVAAKYGHQFSKVDLFTIDEVFGGWQQVQKVHFAEGAMFDQIYHSR